MTIEECGLVATADSVVPFMEAFSNEANRAIFENPRENQAAIEGFMGGKRVHVYSAGMKYPKLQLQFFLDWPHDKYTKITKSGTYRFPLNAAEFQIGKGSTFAEKVFKHIGSYEGLMNPLPSDFNAHEMFGGSIFPITKDIEGIKFKDSVIEKVTKPLEKVFEAGGKGVYYYIVCRSPKQVMSPRQLVETLGFLEKNVDRYRPYFKKNWVSNINEIIPLLKENSAKYSTWIKAEINSTTADYERLQRIPLIRQASVNQQVAAAAAVPPVAAAAAVVPPVAAAAAAVPPVAAAAAGNARRRKTRKGRKGRKGRKTRK